MKLTFKNYCQFVKDYCLNFSKEWTNEEWNQSYINFKEVLPHKYMLKPSNLSVENEIFRQMMEVYYDFKEGKNTVWIKELSGKEYFFNQDTKTIIESFERFDTNNATAFLFGKFGI